MEDNIFKSSLSNRLFDFINFKKAQGYHYQIEINLIRMFDDFLTRRVYPHYILTQEIIDDYVSSFHSISNNRKTQKFSIVKEFSIYLKMFEPDSYLIHKNIFRKTPAKKSYIFTDKEIEFLLKSFNNTTKPNSLQLITNYTILGILAFTGVRISECLNLNFDDWDEEKSLLFIKRGKFGKDRLIPLSDSVNLKLQEFMIIRRKHRSSEKEEPFFINKNLKRVRYESVRCHFKKLLNKLKINNIETESRKPSIHSLRHTFAVKNILKWLKSEKNINNMLPYLSTYMGHVSLSSTQVYLQSIQEMNTIGAEKFHKIFKRNI